MILGWPSSAFTAVGQRLTSMFTVQQSVLWDAMFHRFRSCVFRLRFTVSYATALFVVASVLLVLGPLPFGERM
ncbi:hypothetical protein AFA91_23400 [Mycolicibacterium goodii]|uniref:Uncharacterized protein n=1 Tax=Mycolicibacterium goodii TaxID=134601 RepID=A0A0K0XAE0_MYCGD|nr:hypothetical protein AFA91_23400 [Mycolicibacterium goodii]